MSLDGWKSDHKLVLYQEKKHFRFTAYLMHHNYIIESLDGYLSLQELN